MTGDDLVSRLEKARKTAPGEWVACCPAHDDRSPSLSVKDCGDGRLLLHCFAGCHAGDVVACLGMSLADLMPERAPDKTYRRTPFNALTVAQIISVKAGAAAIAAKDLADGKELSKEDRQALFESAQFIAEAMSYVRAN